MNAAVELLADSVRQAFESAIQLPRFTTFNTLPRMLTIVTRIQFCTRLITSTTDPLADINGLRIYQFRQPDDAQHPIGIVLGELIVNDCPLLDLLSVINNSGMRFKWDDLFDGSTILGGPLPGLDANIVYSKTRAVWPTSARDLVVAISTRRYGDSVIMTASSVPETVCRQLPFPVPTAKQTGCVRAQLDFGSWIFTPMPPESKDAGGRRCDDLHTAAACAERLKVQYLVKTNPNGSIPRAILSMLSKQLPLCIRNAVDCLRSRGACPSVMRLSNTLRLLENRYDPDKHSSLLRLECKPGKALLVVRLDVSSKWLELFNAVQITAPLLEQSRYSADTLHSVLVELQWINAADQVG
jgi:hypothetical protein